MARDIARQSPQCVSRRANATEVHDYDRHARNRQNLCEPDRFRRDDLLSREARRWPERSR